MSACIRVACALALVLAIPARSARAQQSDSVPQDPTAVATAFFRAVAAAQWNDAAGYLDLDAFEPYWRTQIEQARNNRVAPPMTAEHLMRSEPDMPRAVAEYQARKWNQARAEWGNFLSHEFADVSSADSLAALTPREAAARWLEAKDMRYKQRRALEAAHARGDCVSVPPADTLFGTTPPHIVGTVAQDTVAYVLYSMPSPVPPTVPPPLERGRAWIAPAPHVLRLRRLGSAWRIMGSNDMLGSANTVVAFATCKPAPKR